MSEPSKYKWYQFTVETRLVHGGTSSNVQVNMICRLEPEARINTPYIQNLLDDGAARAVKAVGGDGKTAVVGSAIIHSLYLGMATDEEMNPKPIQEKEVLEPQPAEEVDPAISGNIE